MEGLAIGKIVHYVSPNPHSLNQHRPAIVTSVWSPEGLCNLNVFPDGSADITDEQASVVVVTSVSYDRGGSPGTWHEVGPCNITPLPDPQPAEDEEAEVPI